MVVAFIGLFGSILGVGGSVASAVITSSTEHQDRVEQRAVDQSQAQQREADARHDASCSAILNAVGHEAASATSSAAEPERRLMDEGARRCIGLLPAPKDLPERAVENRS